MDALRADSGAGSVLVTPAFPETGRTVYFGHLFVGTVPLNESPLKDHPLTMHDANLVRVLGRQSSAPVGLVDLKTVAGEPDAIHARLRDLEAQGAPAPSSMRCSMLISQPSAQRRWRPRYRSALRGLVLDWRGRSRRRATAPRPEPSRRIRLWRGRSRHRRQLFGRDPGADRSRGKLHAVLRLSPEALMTAPDATLRMRSTGPISYLMEGPVLIATSGTPDDVAAIQARFGRAESALPSSRPARALPPGWWSGACGG